MGLGRFGGVLKKREKCNIFLFFGLNDLFICILKGFGSFLLVANKSGQKWFRGSVCCWLKYISVSDLHLIKTSKYWSEVNITPLGPFNATLKLII